MWMGRRRRVVGQITLESAIGKWLAILAADSAVKSIVEIGAWHGGGSTTIIAHAIRDRLDAGRHAWCLEAHQQRAREAEVRLAGISNVNVIWGVIVTPGELDSADLSDEEEAWFAEDRLWISKAPNVLDELPEEIDLLLLDGGEFSTYAEFHILCSRLTTWLILDDVNTRKCARLFRELTTSTRSDFELIWHGNERNGTAVFRRRPAH